MLWDPSDPLEIPLWSKIMDPISKFYYYHNNFTDITQWELPVVSTSKTPKHGRADGRADTTNNSVVPLSKTHALTTKSNTMNRNIGALRIQCSYRGRVGRERVRVKRGVVHSSLRPEGAEQVERWMTMNESSIIGGHEYFYDTVSKTCAWSPTRPMLNNKENETRHVLNQLTLDEEGEKESEKEEEKCEELTKSMSLRDRRKAESLSPLKKKKTIRRSLSIVTDTPLQPQGVVTPYESPGNTFSEAQEVPDSQQQDTKDTEDAEDAEDTLHMQINSTDRSVGGGATERELASGDTFQELPMVRKEQKETECFGGGFNSHFFFFYVCVF